MTWCGKALRSFLQARAARVRTRASPQPGEAVQRPSAKTVPGRRRQARGRTSGAGPRTTLPWLLYCEPWHGHMNLFSACARTPHAREAKVGYS